MKHLLHILFAFFALVVVPTLHLQAQTLQLGYCTDEIKPSVGNSNLDIPISVAVAITPDLLASYQSLAIKDLQVGFNKLDNVTSIRVWMRHHVSDPDIASWEVDMEQVSAGWNTFTLDTPYLLAQSDTLYLGYEFVQSVKSAIVGSSGIKCKHGMYVGFKGKWKNYGSSYAPLCVRASLVGVNDYDLKLDDLWLDASAQHLGDASELQPLSVHGTLTNFGKQPLSQFAVAWQDGEAQGQQPFSVDLPSCASTSFQLKILPSVLNHHNVPLQIGLLHAETVTDAEPTNNEGTLYYEAIVDSEIGQPRESYLVESFTSLHNGFCRLGNLHAAELLQRLNDRYSGQFSFIPMTQHQGYGPADAYRVSTGNPYSAQAVFGPEELSYAPAVSMHRQRVMSSTLPVDSLFELCCEVVGESATLMNALAVESQIDAERNLHLEVTVTPYSNSWCQHPALVACVVRDLELNADEQYDYYPELVAPYSEKNVVALYLTPSQGVSLLNSPEGTPLGKADLAAVETGRQPRPELAPQTFRFDAQLPESLGDTDSLRVIVYVCAMEEGSQSIDALMVR